MNEKAFNATLERLSAARAKRKAAQDANPADNAEPPAVPAKAPKSRTKKKGFTKTPHDLHDVLKTLKPSERAILVALNRETTGWHREEFAMSAPQLAEEASVSERSVKRAVKSLLKAGLITRREATVNYQKSYSYSISWDGIERRLGGDSVDAKPTLGGDKMALEGVTKWHTLSDSNAVCDGANAALKKDKERDDAKAHEPTSISALAKKKGVEYMGGDSAVGGDSVAGGDSIITLTSSSSTALDAVRADIRARKYDGVRGYRHDGIGLMNLQPWLERRLEANDAAALLGFEVNAPAAPALQRAA